MSEQVLIATLGSEPQVVTLVLDLLRAKGHPIAEVIVVYTIPRLVPELEIFPWRHHPARPQTAVFPGEEEIKVQDDGPFRKVAAG